MQLNETLTDGPGLAGRGPRRSAPKTGEPGVQTRAGQLIHAVPEARGSCERWAVVGCVAQGFGVVMSLLLPCFLMPGCFGGIGLYDFTNWLALLQGGAFLIIFSLVMANCGFVVQVWAGGSYPGVP